MSNRRLRITADYNRGLPGAVRAAHSVCAAVAPAWRFLTDPRRAHVLLPFLAATLLFVLIHPFDGPISSAAARLNAQVGGDLRRELHAWQQFGAVGSLIAVGFIVLLLDRRRAGRLWDLAGAAVLAGLACAAMKALVGRPRPRPEFDDPRTFLGPLGQYPIMVDGRPRLVHAWQTWLGAGTDLWSMPSSHTTAAVVLAVFLARLYPRLTPFVVVCAALVAIARVLFAAHWPTDVIIGAVLGYLIAHHAVAGRWGDRAVSAMLGRAPSTPV